MPPAPQSPRRGGGDPSSPVGALLDEAVAALERVSGQDPGPLLGQARGRLRWAGGWLEPPHAPRATTATPRLLADLAAAFDDLIERLEDEDPIRNASGVQVCSLAFAIVGSVNALLERAKATNGG